MKTKKMLMMSGVLCFLMLTGLKRSIAQDVELPITLPYSGNYNEWTITFTSETFPYQQYYFETDDDTYDSQILGTLPAGTYTIEFNSGHFNGSRGFDFGVTGQNYYMYKIRSDSFTWSGAVIDSSTAIHIDEGY